MEWRTTGEDACFVASNSRSGFYSNYREVFDRSEVDHVYAVKGGPGTGKSRFLREVAACGERKGYHCEYIYCSSDPDSLDAVILSGKERTVALLDATAPHVYEPSHPGFREEIVNLGDFWNAEKLIPHAAEIGELNREKAGAYRRAYRCLAAYGALSDNRDALVAPFVRQEKIRELAARLLQNLPAGKKAEAIPALIRSIGMRGEIGFDTYFSMAEKCFLIEDCHGSAFYLMEEIRRIATERKQKFRFSHDPAQPEKTDGIFFPESRTAFVVIPPEEVPGVLCRKISMRRFMDTAGMKDVRAELNFTARMCRALRTRTVENLAEVRKLHFRVEDIYIGAMDFPAKEAFTKRFCERLFQMSALS